MKATELLLNEQTDTLKEQKEALIKYQNVLTTRIRQLIIAENDADESTKERLKIQIEQLSKNFSQQLENYQHESDAQGEQQQSLCEHFKVLRLAEYKAIKSQKLQKTFLEVVLKHGILDVSPVELEGWLKSIEPRNHHLLLTYMSQGAQPENNPEPFNFQSISTAMETMTTNQYSKTKWKTALQRIQDGEKLIKILEDLSRPFTTQNLKDYLNEHDTNLNVQNKSKGSFLHSLASFRTEENEAEMFNIFIKHGLDVNGRNFAHQTPLIVAIKNKHQDIKPLLIASGVDMNAEDFDGYTALHYAVKMYPRQYEAISRLINDGAEIDYTIVMPLKNDSKMVDYCIPRLESAISEQGHDNIPALGAVELSSHENP
jgi:superfamily II DNA helicase RecQ